MRRVNGMWELKKVMSDKPIAGRSIHILTGGNIDLLSHLLWLLQFWPKVRRVFLSAWAISAVDILMCKRYLEEELSAHWSCCWATSSPRSTKRSGRS